MPNYTMPTSPSTYTPAWLMCRTNTELLHAVKFTEREYLATTPATPEALDWLRALSALCGELLRRDRNKESP